MHLYRVRHGLATWPHWAGHDGERPLTPSGERQLEAAGAGLARRLTTPADPRPSLILHSPLLRARQTAAILARRLGCAAQPRAQGLLAPGFDLDALNLLLAEQDLAQPLMLIGHNPDMMDVVNDLAGQPVKFSEGTVAHLQLGGPARGRLLWTAPAEDLARAAPPEK